MSGEGSVFQRADGKWVAQLSMGGRSRRRYAKRIRPSRREALAALDELKAERLAGVQPSRRSLGSYLRSWLDDTVRPTVSPNTARGYEDAIAHWDPIAHVALADLRAEDIERACNRMRARRYVGGARSDPERQHLVDIGPASAKTIRNAQLMLRAALEQAHARGHVRRNEAKLVRLREVPRLRKPAMTPAMARAILGAIAGDRLEAAYALAMSALRESEILGLAVDDVDLDAGRIRIRQQVFGSGERARLAPTKTPGSAATVDLPEFAAARLRTHFERYDPVALVFTSPRGLAINGSWFTKHFQALLVEAGLPRMTVHDLRAGAASLLAAAGSHPKLAQDFLRHESVTTTLTHYTRTTHAQRRETAEALDRVVTQGVTDRVE